MRWLPLVFLALILAVAALGEASSASEPEIVFVHHVTPEGLHVEEAFERSTVRENRTVADFTFDGNVLPGGRATFLYNPASQPAWITSTSFIQAAIGSWNVITQNLQLSYGGTTAVTSSLCHDDAPDGHDTISWGSRTGGGSLAIATACWWVGAAGECDVVIGTVTQAALTAYQGILAHEIGHCNGLAHSSDQNALLWPSYHGVNVPQSDDINGICSLYGGCGVSPTPGTPLPTSTGTIASTPTLIPFTPTSTPFPVETPPIMGGKCLNANRPICLYIGNVARD